MGFAQTDGECRLKLNRKKTVPYVSDGFTLQLHGFMFMENIERAITRHIADVTKIEDVQYKTAKHFMVLFNGLSE